MTNVFDKEKALGLLKGYQDLLEATGYVKQDVVYRLVCYMFLLDFVDNVYPFLSDKDYAVIEFAVEKLYSGGGCLFPYDADYSSRLAVGKAVNSGIRMPFRLDSTGILRSDDSNTNLRVVEE